MYFFSWRCSCKGPLNDPAAWSACWVFLSCQSRIAHMLPMACDTLSLTEHSSSTMREGRNKSMQSLLSTDGWPQGDRNKKARQFLRWLAVSKRLLWAGWGNEVPAPSSQCLWGWYVFNPADCGAASLLVNIHGDLRELMLCPGLSRQFGGVIWGLCIYCFHYSVRLETQLFSRCQLVQAGGYHICKVASCHRLLSAAAGFWAHHERVTNVWISSLGLSKSRNAGTSFMFYQWWLCNDCINDNRTWTGGG